MQRSKRGSGRLAPSALAVAAAIAIGAPAPMWAQSVSSTGDVSPAITPGAIVDLSGQRIFLGFTNAGVGTQGALNVTGGGSLTAAQIAPGIGGLGTGFVTVSGAGSVIRLTGGAAFNGLDIGSWGTGTATVSTGGLIACTSALGCPFNSIGNAAGSTGTLAINGGAVSGLGSLTVGAGNLLTGFGTPGANTSGTLSITNGGTLSSSGFNSVASNSGQAGVVTGNVTVAGPGSSWAITRDLANGGGQAFLSLAPQANSVANVSINNGGSLTVTGARSSPATDSSIPGINMSAAAGATSTMTVTTGGSVRIGGDSGVITLGGNSSVASAGANATLNITAGGTVAGTGPNGLVFVVVGQNLGSGTLNVDGAGSQLVVAGVGGQNTQGLDGLGGMIVVGRNRNGGGGGSGQLNVTAGGSVLISDNGLTASGGKALQLANGAGSSGTVTVSGAGSSIVVSSTGSGTAVPYVEIGAGGTGQMTVSNGGSVAVQGSGQRSFIVGNSSTGSGTLNVTTGGRINASWFGVGNNGGSGVATIDNSTVNLDGFVNFNAGGIGAAVRVGRGVGANGVLNLQNGAAININNTIDSASVILGGTSVLSGGTGTLNMSGGSTITFTGPATGAFLQVGGQSGTGFMTMAGSSIVDTGATGAVQVGSPTGSAGTLTIGGGSKIFANSGGIGGNSDTVAGGNGAVSVTGVGSLLQLSGASGFLGVGRSGTGSLAVSNQGTVAATVINVGRAAGGLGTLTVDNAVLSLSGQQTSGTQSGAALTIGTLGGTGTVDIRNGSTVTISNSGTAGASLYVGGAPGGSLGTGTLNVSNSQVSVLGAPPAVPVPGQVPVPGLARVVVGYDGSGSATLTNSTLQVGNAKTLQDGTASVSGADGSLIIAQQPGSTGVLSVNAGSVVKAGFVGVGVSQAGNGVTQFNGGSGQLILNSSTLTTGNLEIGAQGILSGDGGVINASGSVIVGGTISPGNSPGRLVINCDLTFLSGSKLVLDILANGSGGYDVDRLILGPNAVFNFANLQVDFNFLGSTDPTAFLASGLFNLDTFLQSGDLVDYSPLASARGTAWNNLFTSGQFIATSDSYAINSFVFTPAGAGGAGGGVSFDVSTAAVPEPSTWLLMALGLASVGVLARRRQRAAALR